MAEATLGTPSEPVESPSFTGSSVGTVGAIASGWLGQLAKWQSKRFAAEAGEEALADIRKNERDIAELARKYPTQSVELRLFFGKIDGNVTQLYYFYLDFGLVTGQQYEPMAVSEGSGSYKKAISRGMNLTAANGTSQLVMHALTLPPMGMKQTTATEPSWMKRYQVVKVNLQQDNLSAAIHALNGSSMYDILRVLERCTDSKDFSVLRNVHDSVSGINHPRMYMAFATVYLRMATGQPLAALMQENHWSVVAESDRKDMMNFLGVDKPMSTLASELVGKWRVKVGRWTWLYTFTDKHRVTWLDQGNGKSGSGKWKDMGDTVKTTWAPSKTVEYWTLPLDLANQRGTALMAEGEFALSATKL